MDEPDLPPIDKFPADKQRILDELLDRSSEGMISPSEEQQLKQLVSEAEALMVSNAKRITEFARTQTPSAPAQAVPVTVWVNPDLAER